MGVEEISYHSAVHTKVTLVFQQAFDGVLALVLAVDINKEQFRLTLTGSDYRFFKLTYGVTDRVLDLLAYQNVSCSEFRIAGRQGLGNGSYTSFCLDA